MTARHNHHGDEASAEPGGRDEFDHAAEGAQDDAVNTEAVNEGVAPEASGAAAPGAEASGTTADATSEAETLAAQRLDDLQRLNAEYVNYKRRVDRDRALTQERAVRDVLEALLPVLDDI